MRARYEPFFYIQKGYRMFKHLRFFLVITIGTSLAIFAMEDNPKRTFKKPLSEQLTPEEEKTRSDLFSMLREQLSIKFAATLKSTATQGDEKRVEIIETSNIKPHSVADLENTDEDCKQMLRRQITLAIHKKQEKDGIAYAKAQEARKKLRAPMAQPKLSAAVQDHQVTSIQSTTSITNTSVHLEMPIAVESVTATRYTQTPTPQEKPHLNLPPVTTSFAELDDLLNSLDIALPQQPPLEKPTLELSNVDITPKIEALYQRLLRVSTTAQQFDSATLTIPEDFSYDLADVDKLVDELAPCLGMKSAAEKIPALDKLRYFTEQIQKVAESPKNPEARRMAAFNAYTASLNALQQVLAHVQ